MEILLQKDDLDINQILCKVVGYIEMKDSEE